MGKCVEGFEGVHRQMVLEKEMQKEDDCWSSVMKELCMANEWSYKANKKKITYSAGGCETEIDFVLLGKNTESK